MTISEFVAALNAKFTTPADPTPFEADKRFVKTERGGPMRKAIRMFETYMLDGLEWQQKIAANTDCGTYRVEVTWALYRWRVSVYRRVQEPEKLIRVHHPHFGRTAVALANKLLRVYNRRAESWPQGDINDSY
jgi:hypothetical protein